MEFKSIVTKMKNSVEKYNRRFEKAEETVKPT